MSISLSKRPSWSTRESLSIVVVLWFAVCWFLGRSDGDTDLQRFNERAYPAAENIERVNDRVSRAIDGENHLLGYTGVGTASGYGGPLQVAIAVNAEGVVESLAVVEHRETPTFFDKVVGSGFLGRLLGQGPDDVVLVDGVTGATFTAQAVAESVHRSLSEIAEDELELVVINEPISIDFGLPELVLIGLFGFAVAQRRLLRGKARIWGRWATLLTGLFVLGFLFNRPFVLAHVNMVLLGYWPDWHTHLYWYILIAGLFLFKARRKWNVYCYDFCPFGAAQEILAKLGGAKPHPVRWPTVLLWLQRLLAIAAVSLALLYRNSGFSSFEIFGVFFTLTGSNYQFILLALVLLMSLLLYRPWCRYLCPLHRNTMEGLFDRCRSNLNKLWLLLRTKTVR